MGYISHNHTHKTTTTTFLGVEGGPKINGGSDCVVIIIDHEKSNILAGHGQDETSNYNFSSFFVIIFLVWDFIKEKEKKKKRFGDRESS